MRKFHHIFAFLLLAATTPSWGADRPDLDGITMEVLRNDDAREVIHDIKLPPELEKRLEQQSRPGSKSTKDERHSKQKEDKREKRERKEESDARKERAEEIREEAEEIKEEAKETEEEVEDGS